MSKRMNVLVACEESQAVTIQLRKRGHRAFSCDLMECSGGHPEWHIRWDATALLNGDCNVLTQDGILHSINGKLDMIIAHPPCTDLASSGARHFKAKREDGRQQASIDFFMRFTKADCERVAIENPIGIMSTVYRKPDQIIQPWQFGHPETKATCLWLRGLSKLVPTNDVKEKMNNLPKQEKHRIWYMGSGHAKERSVTYPGVACAMAEQWAGWATDAIKEAKTE